MVLANEVTAVLAILTKTHQLTMLEQFKDYTPFQLLVMTLLSSRTRDTTTIPLVKKLFEEFPEPDDFLKVPLHVLEKKLYGIGFYKTKANNVKKLSTITLEKYNGKIPDTLEGLTSLPGVGRKTANCVLAYAFRKPAIAVDIHVHRISNRLGWITTETPEDTEEKLKKIVPSESWVDVNKLLVNHGQRICLPRNPKCEICPVNKYCNYGRKKLGIKDKS